MEANRLDKFRASYSVLSTWETGDIKRAIDQYLKIDTYTTPQMEMGKKFHGEWENEVKRYKCLPKVFGGQPLLHPRSEEKIVIQVADWLDFVFVADCVDQYTLHEFKSGANDANYWSNTWQTPIYAYGLLANGHRVNKAYIHSYNPYNQKVTKALVWMTPAVMQDALDKLWTLSSEMWDYIQQNKEQLRNYLNSHGN